MVANVLFLVALVLGGVIVPLSDLPPPSGRSRSSPGRGTRRAFRAALGGGGDALAGLVVVAIWGAVAAAAAARIFRWD